MLEGGGPNGPDMNREGPAGTGEGGREGGAPSAVGAGLPPPASMTPPPAAGAGVGAPPTAQAPTDPFTQLVNMILRSQLQGALGAYFNPTMPGQGSAFTPGQTVAPTNPNVATPPAAGAAAGTPMLPGATGAAAPAPNGGFTPGLPDPSQIFAFNQPSQTPLPTPTSGIQGPAGNNQGWQQFLGMLGINLPQPDNMAGGGSMLFGS
jgi:hypothetical protein